MGDVLPRVLLFALVPVVATLAGGVIATYRTPGPRLRSALQHFALVASISGSAFGVGTHLALRRVAARRDVREAGARRVPRARIGAIGTGALLHPVLRERHNFRVDAGVTV